MEQTPAPGWSCWGRCAKPRLQHLLSAQSLCSGEGRLGGQGLRESLAERGPVMQDPHFQEAQQPLGAEGGSGAQREVRMDNLGAPSRPRCSLGALPWPRPKRSLLSLSSGSRSGCSARQPGEDSPT